MLWIVFFIILPEWTSIQTFYYYICIIYTFKSLVLYAFVALNYLYFTATDEWLHSFVTL